MAEIVPLRPSEHDAVQRLLPWRVNGTLEPEEAAQVDAHLAECEACRRDLVVESELAREVALLPLDVEEAWRAMALRLPEPAEVGAAGVPRFSRSGPVGWALGGALAASVVAAVTIAGLQRPADPSRTFHTLGSPGATAPGQAIVLFKPDTTAGEMREILAAEGARMVDGPTTTGAYVLRIDGRSPAEAIAALRRSNDVVLAEPLASDGRP